MLSHGTVRTDFDFDSPGKRSGFINLSHSDNDHAFSVIQLPVGVICNGSGPTVLLSAGNHGDEYEGQVILHQLMQRLTPQDVQGRIIFLPALNLPAVHNRSRISPLDLGNMNRSFATDANAGPTAAIAGFVKAHLIAMADVILDFHSGGGATEYVDCGFLCVGPDADLNRENMQLAQVFGAPFTMVCPIDGQGGDFDTAAHLQQTRFLSCELGGLARFSNASFQVGWQAVQRVLAHLKLTGGSEQAQPTRFIDLGARSCFATAAHHGLAQTHVALGAVVHPGDHVATLYDLHNFGQIRAEFHADRTGVVAIRRRNPVVRPGDHLCLICEEIPSDQVL
ncbi:MAG: succinylglutamate desuccinylase/aspartoacylase family protein [Sedimentitalea sp.]